MRRHLPLLQRRRGFAAVLAMMFLAILATLSLAMFSTTTNNVRVATNLSDADRARLAAESGLRWQQQRLDVLRPKSGIGNFTAAEAAAVWTALRASLLTDYAAMSAPGVGTITSEANKVGFTSLALDGDGTAFSVLVEKLPAYSTDPASPTYRHFIRLTSTGIVNDGRARELRKTVSLTFRLDKKVRYAVIGRVPLQIGRNTLVEGPIAMATPGVYPPILSLSDFAHLTPALTSRVNAFRALCEARPGNYDNRVAESEASDWAAARTAGFSDTNGDLFIDEYDLFLDAFDRNGDKGVTTTEFTNTSTGQLYDANLFAAIDALGAPMIAGETPRSGYSDGRIDELDLYTKIAGQISLATSSSGWTTNLAGQGLSIGDMMGGPISTDLPTQTPVRFGVPQSEMFDLAPANFSTAAFLAKTGTSNGAASKTSTVMTNTTLAATDANGGTAVERTPFGSTSWQATYKRPVFKNITFKNCRIPKGLNALFDNCSFEGVTFVQLEENITKSNGTTTTTSASDGSAWAAKMISGTFSNTTTLTNTNSHGFNKGNNLRFNGCTFKGPLASDVPTAYTHFANSWEFTGATKFDNQTDATATIVAPQTNIEMGSFTNPLDAPSKLVGVVVAGNIDIRGTSVIDGSLIVTGDGAGSTTLGWFGSSDSDTSATAMPEGGFGRLNIRYNPRRALPDGINVKVDLVADADTYSELKS